MSMPVQNDAFVSAMRADKRQIRQSRLLKAALQCDRLGRFDVTIRNISGNGLGGRSRLQLDLGERLVIQLPGQRPNAGTVRWVQDDRFGIETDDSIKLGELRTAHGGYLPTADSRIEFRVAPPIAADTKRPTLSVGVAGRSDR